MIIQVFAWVFVVLLGIALAALLLGGAIMAFGSPTWRLDRRARRRTVPSDAVDKYWAQVGVEQRLGSRVLEVVGRIAPTRFQRPDGSEIVIPVPAELEPGDCRFPRPVP